MTVVFAGSDPRELFSHVLLYGAGALCEDAGLPDVHLSWTRGSAPRPSIAAAGLNGTRLAGVVRQHAQEHSAGSWLQLGQPAEPDRGLMSSRLKPPRDAPAWQQLQAARWRALDELRARPALLDLRLLNALGEPAHWPVRRAGDVLPDEGASRFDMQPRNQGSELVGTKLRPLAEAVARRTEEQVRAGLLGEQPLDELAGQRADGRTATNLRLPGPTDTAQAWVALWGISQTTVAHQVLRSSRTATHVPRQGEHGPRAGTFVLPVWQGAWRPARLRGVLRSAALADVGADLVAGVEPKHVARSWLAQRGVLAVLTFPVSTGGSKSAPERRALEAALHRLGQG